MSQYIHLDGVSNLAIPGTGIRVERDTYSEYRRPGEIFVPGLKLLKEILRVYRDETLIDVLAWNEVCGWENDSKESLRWFEIATVRFDPNNYPIITSSTVNEGDLWFSIGELTKGRLVCKDKIQGGNNLVKIMTDTRYASNLACEPHDIWCEELYVDKLIVEEDEGHYRVEIQDDMRDLLSQNGIEISINERKAKVDVGLQTLVGHFLSILKGGELTDYIYLSKGGKAYSPYMDRAIDLLQHPFRLDEFLRIGKLVSNTKSFYNETEVFSLMNARTDDNYTPNKYILSSDRKRYDLLGRSTTEFLRW